MRKEPFPGAKCRVVGSVRGPNGTSVGRIVRAVALNGIPHQVWGDMWDCEQLDGKPFDVRVAAPDGSGEEIKQMNNATFASDWLEILDEDPPEQKVKERETQLTE